MALYSPSSLSSRLIDGQTGSGKSYSMVSFISSSFGSLSLERDHAHPSTSQRPSPTNQRTSLSTNQPTNQPRKKRSVPERCTCTYCQGSKTSRKKSKEITFCASLWNVTICAHFFLIFFLMVDSIGHEVWSHLFRLENIAPSLIPFCLEHTSWLDTQ